MNKYNLSQKNLLLKRKILKKLMKKTKGENERF